MKVKLRFSHGYLIEDVLKVLKVQRNGSSESGGPHLRKRLDDTFKIFECNVALSTLVKQTKTLFSFFFFRSILHDIDIVQIFVKGDESVVI